jgi:hypothetical protein
MELVWFASYIVTRSECAWICRCNIRLEGFYLQMFDKGSKTKA